MDVEMNATNEQAEIVPDITYSFEHVAVIVVLFPVWWACEWPCDPCFPFFVTAETFWVGVREFFFAFWTKSETATMCGIPSRIFWSSWEGRKDHRESYKDNKLRLAFLWGVQDDDENEEATLKLKDGWRSSSAAESTSDSTRRSLSRSSQRQFPTLQLAHKSFAAGRNRAV